MKIKTLLSFVIVSLLLSCNNPKETNTWIGTEIHYKGVGLRPNRVVLNNGRLFHLDSMKYTDSLNSEGLFKVENLELNLKRRENNRTVYEFVKDTHFTLAFRRLKKFHSTSFIPVLNQKWIKVIEKENESFNIKEYYNFDYPQLEVNRLYFLQGIKFYSEKELFKLDTLVFDKQNFLLLRQGNALSLHQIKKVTSNELILFFHNSYYGNNEKFKKTFINQNGSSEVFNRFELCNENRLVEYFYGENLKRNKFNKREMLSYFKKNYRYPIDTTQNGYIRIRFVVSCNGTTGRFSVQEMDRNYMEKRFPLQITQQLFVLTSQLDGWLPKKWGHNESVDYNIHIGFKVKNGQIDEILP